MRSRPWSWSFDKGRVSAAAACRFQLVDEPEIARVPTERFKLRGEAVGTLEATRVLVEMEDVLDAVVDGERQNGECAVGATLLDRLPLLVRQVADTWAVEASDAPAQAHASLSRPTLSLGSSSQSALTVAISSALLP